MKPLPFIIFGVYILLYVLAGFIFGVMPVVNALVVMFILATIIYIWILVEEKPWKFSLVGENLAAYALMAYGIIFFLLDGSREKWHAVQEYHHPLRGDRPGSCGEYIVYGNWTNRWFGVKSPDDAREQLEKFKNTLKTVGDIYRRFIESDVRAREKDIEAYDKKVEREKALPDCIE